MRDPDGIVREAARTLDFTQPIALMLMGFLGLVSDYALGPHNTKSGATPYTPRSPRQIAGYFDGLRLLEPGIVSCPRWRTEVTPFGKPGEVAVFGGIGIKA